MPGTIIKVKRYESYDVSAVEHIGVQCLFGDNMERKGYGGQARACRGYVNTIGIPTKWYPALDHRSFFCDADLDNVMVLEAIDVGFRKATVHLNAGGIIALPTDGLGTGLAMLDKKAPKILSHITERVDALYALASNVLGAYHLTGPYQVLHGDVPEKLGLLP